MEREECQGASTPDSSNNPGSTKSFIRVHSATSHLPPCQRTTYSDPFRLTLTTPTCPLTVPAHANPSTTPTMRTQPHATPPPSSLQVPPHMTSDPADLRDVACWRIVSELSVLYPQASDPVSLMTREHKPHGNCTVSIFLMSRLCHPLPCI